MCGADLASVSMAAAWAGSSPRVRSGRSGRQDHAGRGRIISACAERTAYPQAHITGQRDHLRVCGADEAITAIIGPAPGSSPRVRSGRGWSRGCRRACGIISACAERTAAPLMASVTMGDHLRVCGADVVVRRPLPDDSGSSPRVRSGRSSSSWRCTAAGIISACAEWTTNRNTMPITIKDHLRVCGADDVMLPVLRYRMGSSPRVRSGHERR